MRLALWPSAQQNGGRFEIANADGDPGERLGVAAHGQSLEHAYAVWITVRNGRNPPCAVSSWPQSRPSLLRQSARPSPKVAHRTCARPPQSRPAQAKWAASAKRTWAGAVGALGKAPRVAQQAPSAEAAVVGRHRNGEDHLPVNVAPSGPLDLLNDGVARWADEGRQTSPQPLQRWRCVSLPLQRPKPRQLPRTSRCQRRDKRQREPKRGHRRR
jgi:hypothetical protein